MKLANSPAIGRFEIASVLLLAILATQGAAAAEEVKRGAEATLAKASASALEPRVDRAGGVTVRVTPRRLDPKGAWEFFVALDTHSQDLSQDMTRSAALVDGQGKRHAPLAWEGAAPGGHHREGVLKFKPPVGDAEAVVLELNGIGGVPVRTFRWQVR
ncbi:MAG TPA: hypothetical protein VFR86_18910 [Burkholderiaceae bacterium]|nr:hypothetical protein [Burkholderiaceae bacterium]